MELDVRRPPRADDQSPTTSRFIVVSIECRYCCLGRKTKPTATTREREGEAGADDDDDDVDEDGNGGGSVFNHDRG